MNNVINTALQTVQDVLSRGESLKSAAHVQGESTHLLPAQLQKLYAIQQNRRKLLKQEEEIKKEILRLTNEKNVVCGGFAYTKSLRKGSVKYADIPQLKNVNLDAYRGADITAWKLTKI